MMRGSTFMARSSASWRWAILVAGAPLFLATAMFAGLEFDHTDLVMSDSSGTGGLSGVFNFKNSGSEVVTILEVHPDCRCIAVRLSQQQFKPGESGSLQVSIGSNGAIGGGRHLIQLLAAGLTPLHYALTVDAPGKPSDHSPITSGDGAADLHFARTRISIAGPADAERVAGAFKFKNTGSSTVTIEDARPSCPCLSVHLSSKQLKPGEEGGVEVAMVTGDRTGRQIETVQLETDDGRARLRYTLTFVAELSSSVALDRRLTFWGKGEHRGDHEVIIESAGDKPIAFLRVVPAREGLVKVAIVPIQQAKKYGLIVTPLQPSGEFKVRIDAHVTDEAGREKIYSFFAAGG